MSSESDSIRLLRLHSTAIDGDPIRCTLEVHRLYDPCRPIFEALSYTWADSQGDSSFREAVFAGQHYDILPVTRNCMAALRRFRSAADRLIWVDAICINQFDLEERGHQVSLMRDIYISAARVLTYLGDRHDLSNIVVASPNSNDLPPDILRVNIGAIMRMPYFSRIWVIQEVLLSKVASLTFDTHTSHWEEISLYLKLLPSSIGAGLSGNWMEQFGSIGGERNLLSLLIVTKNCRCSDLRDHVYGLMGLVTEKERENLPIDYSISVQQLYIGLAMYWLTSKQKHSPSRSSEVLDLALLPKVTPFLPSWAPDWAPQSHANVNEECISSTPLTFQLVTTGIEGSSSGLVWSIASRRSKAYRSLRMFPFRWRLDDSFWREDCFVEKGGKSSSEISLFRWNELAQDAGWEPRVSVRPLPQNGALAVDAVHILSTSRGKVELADIDGRLLHGLQLADFEESGLGERSLPQHDIHLHILLNWKQAFALGKHADTVYSLYSRSRIVCAPSGTPVPSSRSNVAEIYWRIESLEAEIVEHWPMDLFFYGLCAGPAYASSRRGSRIQKRWSKHSPLASAACQASNFPFDTHMEEDDRQSNLAVMRETHDEVMDFVVENAVSWQIPPNELGDHSLLSRSTSSERYLFQEEYRVRSSRHARDLELAARIQQAQATKIRTASSPQELCTHLRSVVKGHRDSCKNYSHLETALSDISDSALRPLMRARLEYEQFSPVCPLLETKNELGDRKKGRFVLISLTLDDIIHTAWTLLEGPTIDPKFTLEQNFNILWIYVLTMEMVARLRGVLQQRLILKAIGDKMRKVQKIYLI